MHRNGLCSIPAAYRTSGKATDAIPLLQVYFIHSVNEKKTIFTVFSYKKGVTKYSSFSVRKRNLCIEQKEPDLSSQYRYRLCRLLFNKNKK